MSIHPEKRTLDAIRLLAKAPDLSLSQLVQWLLARSSISRATAYRIVKKHMEKNHD